MIPAPGLATRAAAAAQVFVADPGRPQLDDGDRHHLFSVLRLRRGEAVVASDGAGRWCLCHVGGDPLDLDAMGEVEIEERRGAARTVAFAPAKGDRPEWVVQKLTELGIDRIVPLVTERTVVRWAGPRADKARDRLVRVAREAAAQSRRVWLPDIAPVTGFSAFCEAVGHDGSRAALAQLGGPPLEPGTEVIAVGPEGGWSDTERSCGLGTVGLGDGVLRAETAAVAAGVLLSGWRAGTVATREDGPRVGES